MSTSASYGGQSPLSNKQWIVYILRCHDDTHYIGCTSNLTDRLNRHKKGWIPVTKARIPVDLVTYIVFSNKFKAFAFEKYLKSGSGRAFAKKDCTELTPEVPARLGRRRASLNVSPRLHAEIYTYGNFGELRSHGAKALAMDRGYNPLSKKHWIVYILRCRDDTHYIGCTSNLIDRLNRNTRGWIPATKARGPRVLHCVLRQILRRSTVAQSFQAFAPCAENTSLIFRNTPSLFPYPADILN